MTLPVAYAIRQRLNQHLGNYIPTGLPDVYGFNGIDGTQSPGDTVTLTFD